MHWAYVAGYFDGEGHVQFRAAPSRPDYRLIGLTWSNTHLRSLELIQECIGCGIITHRKRYGDYKQGHVLHIERVLEIIRVSEAMLPYLIVKFYEVTAMLAWAKEHRHPQTEKWGMLGKIGVQEISRLYHEEGLTQAAIGEKFGLSGGAVSTFFLRNGIKGRRRGPKQGAYGILAQHGTEKIKAMYESGMTLDEISAELGVQYNTVYMHLYNRGIRLRATQPIRRARMKKKQRVSLSEPEADSEDTIQPSLFASSGILSSAQGLKKSYTVDMTS